MDDVNHNGMRNSGISSYSGPDCCLESHIECESPDCEVAALRAKVERISDVQVELTRVGGYAAIAISSITLPALLAMNFWSHQKGTPWPIPWEAWIVVLSVLCAPFGVKVIIELRRVIPWLGNGK